MNASALSQTAARRARAVHLRGRERRNRVRLRDAAGELRSEAALSGRLHRARRPASRLRQRLELPLESADLRGRRLRARSSSISTARPATARRSPIRSAATGAASRSRTCRRACRRRSRNIPWLDGERMCALGASYGGYMMNWIAGNWTEPFKCIVNHDGIFDTRGMAYVDRGAVVQRMGERRHAVRSAGELREVQPGQPRRQVEQADAGDRTASRTFACRTRRPGDVHRRCSAAASRAACWSSRTRITGCSSPRTACNGIAKSRSGSTSGPQRRGE